MNTILEALKELNKKAIKEDLASDLAQYQKWVDYDMDKYGKISEITQEKLKKAGLEVVKDDFGDYEVIAKEDQGEQIKEDTDQNKKSEVCPKCGKIKEECEGQEHISEGKDVLKGANTIATVLNKNQDKLAAAGNNLRALRSTVLEILDSEELKDNPATEEAKKIFGTVKDSALLSTLATYMIGIKVINPKNENLDKIKKECNECDSQDNVKIEKTVINKKARKPVTLRKQNNN